MTLLGVVGKFGPMTPYAVRQHFTTSPTSRFSGSTGSIYPALERLEDRGWLRSQADARGAQARRLYELAAAGRKALQAWFDDADAQDLEAPHDPLRTRLYFVGLLPPRRRRAFLEAAVAGLEERVADEKRYLRELDDPVSRMAAEGGLVLQRARLRWLRKVLAEVEA